AFAAFLLLAPLAAVGTAQPEKLLKTFSQITKNVEPAVVSIDTKGAVPESTAKGAPSEGSSDEVMEFLRRQMQQRAIHAVGSGFIVDDRGYILTNAHVIEAAVRITVKLDSGEEFAAKLIGSDEETDLAVLKIEAGRQLP